MKMNKMLSGVLALVVFSALPTQADDLVVTLDVSFANAGPNSPGTWELLGRIVDTAGPNDGSNGLAAVRALLDGIDYGTNGDAVTIAPGIGAINPVQTFNGPRNPVLLTSGGTVDLLYGQDISTPSSVVGGVGVGGDDLIASGTFSAGDVPAFGDDDQGLTTDANFLAVAPPGTQTAAYAPDNIILEVVTSVVPEPASPALVLFGGVLGIGARRSRR